MSPELLAVLAQQAPAIIAGIRALFLQQHPGLPLPTDAEIQTALHALLASSRALDRAWEAHHPEVA